MKKIKVCHFTSVHSWNDIRIFEKECVSLAEAGFEVHLVAPNALEGIHKNVRVHTVDFRPKSRIDRMRRLASKVYQKALAVDADIYHFHDPELLPYGLKLQKKGKKTIYDSHEDVPLDILDKEWIQPGIVRKGLSYFYDRYEKRVAKQLSGVVSVLESITEKFAPVNRVTIHNFPRSEDFPPAKQDETDTGTIPVYKVVYNGGLTAVRGIDKMTAAFSHLDNRFRLVLMGNWESPEFEEKCKNTPGWEKVTYLGNLKLDACFAEVQSAHIGLVLFGKIPNHLNSLPNKSFEFIAARLPMLMSDIPFWQTEFGAYAHFADPENPKEIAAQIAKIAENYPAEKEKSIRESKKILQTKTWDNEKNKLVSFYKKIHL